MASKVQTVTKAKAAPSVRKTIFDYENSRLGRGTEDFTKLAEEFVTRLGIAQEQKRKMEEEGRKVANG